MYRIHRTAPKNCKPRTAPQPKQNTTLPNTQSNIRAGNDERKERRRERNEGSMDRIKKEQNHTKKGRTRVMLINSIHIDT